MRALLASSVLIFAGLVTGCSDGSEADRLGIGAQCTSSDQCDDETDQVCLTEFAGGYCGLAGCTSDLDCPLDSACIAHDAASNYCFRTCLDKAECNANRDVDHESNCSSNVTFVDDAGGRKACVPPSSGA